MLKTIITQDDDRIGRRVINNANKIGWIETIFQYNDDSERWRVVGDEINIITTCEYFQILPEEKRDFRLPDSQSSVMRRELRKEEIIELLLEALSLKKRESSSSERERNIFRLKQKIQKYLVEDIVSIACTSHISRAYVDLLTEWQKEDLWYTNSQIIAGKILQLRNRDKREQSRK